MAGIKSITALELLSRLNGHLEGKGIISMPDAEVYLHKDTPVFNGPYSNECYQNRIREALRHYAEQAGLPARLMFSEIFVEEAKVRGDFHQLIEEAGQTEPGADDYEEEGTYQKAMAQFLRAVTKTSRYRNFVAEKIEKSERASAQVGNLYTASIFLALMSTLEADLRDGTMLEGKEFGFFAYGSGSKSKVFAGHIQEGWKAIVSRFRLMDRLAERKVIDYPTYEKLHRGKLSGPVEENPERFALHSVREDRDDQEGARAYDWLRKVSVEV